ncbi:hypothetical protein BH11PLA2_BH11PLA2_35380 [soil metagenome]
MTRPTALLPCDPAQPACLTRLTQAEWLRESLRAIRAERIDRGDALTGFAVAALGISLTRNDFPSSVYYRESSHSFNPPTHTVTTTQSPTADLTVTQKVILASHALEKQGQSPFSAEALIVECWKGSPNTFGLKGFAAAYPDSNRVLAVIMGERGLARQGWLVKVGTKLYTLSDRGRKEAERIHNGEEAPPKVKAERTRTSSTKVNRDTEKFILRVSSTTAVRRFRTGAKFEITFRDAASFWGVADPTDLISVRKAAALLPDELAKANELFTSDKIVLSNGQQVSTEEMKLLGDVHAFLSQQFARQLDLPRVRR